MTHSFHVADWNAFDWVLIGILLLSTLRALFRGLVRAMFSLLGVLAGFQLATWDYLALADWFLSRRWINTPTTAHIVGFLCIALGVIVLFELVGQAVKKTAHSLGLGLFDRLLGGIFGFARGVLLGVALIMAVTAFAPQSTWFLHSRLTSYFLAAAHAVSFVVPHDLRQDVPPLP
jgi:membrane protein required for colicin V production